MTQPAVLAELWRGEILESIHLGHAVIVDEAGEIVEAWGDPEQVIYPRSSAKPLQALPLVESGAADRASLGPEALALACASHAGAAMHAGRVGKWLDDLGLSEADLRCGPQTPRDRDERHGLRAAGERPCQLHNNCSGKHAGFLTLGRELGGGTEYIDPDHPVQRAARAAFEDMTGEDSPGFGIDGCSAPNFACTLHGFGRAIARLAAPHRLEGTRRGAAERLVAAMSAHPEMLAGHGEPATEITAAASGAAAIKNGAEGVYAAMLPQQRLGIVLKISDGADRAAAAAIAALLVRRGVLPQEHPAIQASANAPQYNRRKLLTGHLRAADHLY
ncbi:asparaginase [Halovulum sp. GXIMD14794]